MIQRALLFLFFAACSGGNSGNPDSTIPDAGVGNVDAVPACDPGTPSPCGVDEKCASFGGEEFCAPVGVKLLNESCIPTDGQTADNCGAGLHCLPKSNGNFHCEAVCIVSTNAGCDQGETCFPMEGLFGGHDAGVCLSTCSVSGSCEDGEECDVIDGNLFCVPEGSGTENESCVPPGASGFDDCGDGLSCRGYPDGSSRCAPDCTGSFCEDGFKAPRCNPATAPSCIYGLQCVAQQGEYSLCLAVQATLGLGDVCGTGSHCSPGLACVNGTCGDACEDSNGCGTDQGCDEVGAILPDIGICEAECDPVAQNCPSGEGCYAHGYNANDEYHFMCDPSTNTSTQGQEALFGQQCVPGLDDHLAGSVADQTRYGNADAICTRYCSPVKTTSTVPGSPAGSAPNDCNGISQTVDYECRFLNSLYVYQDDAPSDAVGVCVPVEDGFSNLPGALRSCTSAVIQAPAAGSSLQVFTDAYLEQRGCVPGSENPWWVSGNWPF